jgi:hypothetical protein
VIEQLISLIGALMILGAYGAQQFHKLSATSALYLMLNFAGAVILGIIAIRARQLGLSVVEGAWALISLFMLFKYSLRPR